MMSCNTVLGMKKRRLVNERTLGLRENSKEKKSCLVKANLHRGRARSCHAYSFVCCVASGNSAPVHGSATPGRNRTKK